LLGLLAVAVMVFAYALTSRLNAASQFVAIDRDHNGKVMSQAKRALIGWMAMNAAGTDGNPGRLPCPEGVNSIGTDAEGIAAPTVTPATPNCATVGRLPWRTLGLDKLVDASSEPLWYAVSPSWTLQNSSSLLTINSDSRGQMTVDGTAAPNEVVALIIAPGPAMNVQGATGCTARNQSRSTPTPSMDPRDYVECFNSATPSFSTVGPSTSFNDQVIRVTTADLFPALEAAVQQRMQREIAPALKSVYGSGTWGTSTGNPLFPFAVPFGDPGTSNNYQGANGTYQGLLPFNCSATNCATDARYAPTFVSWSSFTWPTVSETGGWIVWSSCNFPNSSTVRCSGVYAGFGTVTLRMTARANNAAMALRQLTPGAISVRYGLFSLGAPQPGNGASATFNSNGSANLTMTAAVPGLLSAGLPLDVMFEITADLGVLSDHPLLDKTDPTTGWFVRNEWYRLVYYAAAEESTADGLPSHGCDSTDCLLFNNVRNIRSLLVLAGRSINDAARPNGSFADYLEYDNGDFGTAFEGIGVGYMQRAIRMSKAPIIAINAPFNDRVVLVDWSSPLQEPVQVVDSTVPPVRLARMLP
jgi:hypothetical protein